MKRRSTPIKTLTEIEMTAVCQAYDQGFGYGLSGVPEGNTRYAADTNEAAAFARGYANGVDCNKNLPSLDSA